MDKEQTSDFRFGDIVRLDDLAVQKVMYEIDFGEMAKALEGADAGVQDKVFRNISKRVALKLREYMDREGRVPPEYAEEARQKIVSVIHHLEDTEEIVLPEDPEDSEPDETVLAQFKDIMLLDDQAVQRVMREVDSQDLAKALKSADAGVQDKFFRNMSNRAALMIKEDMDYMHRVRIKDAEEAQRKIISIIYHLNGTGEIVTPEDSWNSVTRPDKTVLAEKTAELIGKIEQTIQESVYLSCYDYNAACVSKTGLYPIR